MGSQVVRKPTQSHLKILDAFHAALLKMQRTQGVAEDGAIVTELLSDFFDGLLRLVPNVSPS